MAWGNETELLTNPYFHKISNEVKPFAEFIFSENRLCQQLRNMTPWYILKRDAVLSPLGDNYNCVKSQKNIFQSCTFPIDKNKKADIINAYV